MNKERLLEVLMVGEAKPLTDEQIAEAEKRCRMRFPAEFKRFMAKWNSAEFASFSCLRLCDLTDIPEYQFSPGLGSQEILESLLEEVKNNKDLYPGITFDTADLADVDLLCFADDVSELESYLMIDRKDPEHYWIFSCYEGDFTCCVDSFSAFLDDRFDSYDEYCYSDDRTWKQKLADRLYGERPRSLGGKVIPDGHFYQIKEPSRFLTGFLDDVPQKDAPSKAAIDGQSFAAILPTGDLIPMTFVPADAEGSRPFWISYYPVPNDQFLPPNRLDDSITSGAAPAEVSAEDAELFCSILTDFFAKSLPDGYAFALPTDAEYQRALKHADETSEKPKTGVFSSFLKLFVRPNPAPEHLTEILLRDLDSGAEKLPFYIVLTAKRS